MWWCQVLKAFIFFIFGIVIQESVAQNSINDLFNQQNLPKPIMRWDPTYLVIASKMVRPGKIYRLTVTIFQAHEPIRVTASIQRNGISQGSTEKLCQVNELEILMIQMPTAIVNGRYTLKVEGNLNGALGGTVFMNSSSLIFSQKSMTIFIQTNKPFYQQGQIVKFRTVPVNTDLKAFDNSLDVYMLDPNGKIMKRWMSRQTNLGAVSLTYPLSRQPVIGTWTIKVVAQGQVEEETFLVEEYYQTRYEVKVSMPSIFKSTDRYIHGTVMANYTSGVPVQGNLTLKASVRKLRKENNLQDDALIEEKFFEYFPGHKEFHFPMPDFKNQNPDSEIKIEAIVGEYYFNMTVSGHCFCLIYNSSMQLKFLGASPQVIKPPMPFKAYLALSYFDGAPVPEWIFKKHRMVLRSSIELHNGGRRDLDIRWLEMSSETPGLWKAKIDLNQELLRKSIVNEVHKITLKASYTDEHGGLADAELVAFAPRNHKNHMLQVGTSSKKPKVGEYIIFHVRMNYYAQKFHYVLISKGIILLSGRKDMKSRVKTFAVPLSPEMAPTSTLVVYHVSKSGYMTADSITFPVDGISRNKFTIQLNDQKDKSGNTVEVRVIGEPGAYVALSGVDKQLCAMQAGNELTHAEVLRRMAEFDEEVNSTLSHIWMSREGEPDLDVYFPSSSYGIDVNRTFDFAGLLAFTDSNMTAPTYTCNRSRGYLPCLTKGCYHFNQQCDGVINCPEDELDESNCPLTPLVNIKKFRLGRCNRIQSLYDDSWLWRDINIGPKGYYLFQVKVPVRPIQWVITSYGVSRKKGFGVVPYRLHYNGVRPFFMIVETPDTIMQHEQLGIRASLFNYMNYEIEALVILANSPDYKFVHVEGMGIVQSYRPRTSHEQHQHLVWIKAGSARDVYIPIVPTKLKKFNVTITARSLVGKETVIQTIDVKADGVPQHTHTSLTLDLSQASYQLQYLDMNITESPIIPYRLDRRYIFGSNRARISVVGDVVGPAFPEMPMNAMNLLRKPYGTGESSMFNFACNLNMLLYMRLAGLRNTKIEKRSFKYLNIDYQRLMTYQHEDGSFSPFRWNSRGSVWLTAFCAKSLFKATIIEWENFLYIDPSVISRAMSWLVAHQTVYGAFYETLVHPYDRKMNLSSDFEKDYGRFRNISLTAHVLITLCEVRNLPGGVGSKVAGARTLARKYLETMINIIDKFEDPYELAIVSYALTISKSSKGEKAFNMLYTKIKKVSGMYYWGRDDIEPADVTIQNGRPYLMPRLPSEYFVNNVETTAYGLLTHVARQAVIQKEIVLWLNSQRLHDGGWGSTQDTIVAMQGLMDYSVQSRLRDVTGITVSIEVPSMPEYIKHLQIREDNLLDLQILDIPSAWGVVVVKAEGTGMALLQLSMQYNVDWKIHQIPPPVPAYNVDVKISYSGKNSSNIAFTSCQRWTNIAESPRSGLSVLDVTIPTGYVIQQQVLDAYVKSRMVRNLKRAKFFPKKLLFYFDYLDRFDICVNFSIQRWFPVANNSRYLPIKVYDYYAPERFNETFLDVYNLYVLNICQVCGSYQCPYCPIFSWAGRYHANLCLIISLSSFVIITRHFFALPYLIF